ncbi:MAG: DUF1003 domain-containing protein [Rhabdochlamydiaceae bacterium]
MEPAKSPYSFVQNNIENRRHMFRRLRAKTLAKQHPIEKLAVRISRYAGTVEFLLVNIYAIALWIFLQSDIVPGIKSFDPYPFVFLVTFLSLEAILLTIFILISQHQQEKFENLREQITLQFDIITEEEITKLIQLTSLIAKKNNIDVSRDDMLQEMIQPIDLEKIESALEKQMEE